MIGVDLKEHTFPQARLIGISVFLAFIISYEARKSYKNFGRRVNFARTLFFR